MTKGRDVPAAHASSDPVPQDYATILAEIKARIHTAQYEALKAVNRKLISLYWDIGRMIVERQQKGSWGKAIVEILARGLQTEFPGMSGFSARNIWNMRSYYFAYHNHEKLQTLSAEISWSHNLTILERCKIEDRRFPPGIRREDAILFGSAG